VRRDAPDERDHFFSVPKGRRALPGLVDLRSEAPPVYNQHSLNSCSANAIAAAIRFDHRRGGDPGALNPSRLFIYFNERSIEDLVAQNVPVSLRDGYKTLARVGVCAEDDWPYRVGHFARRPPRSCYHRAVVHRAIAYKRVRQDLRHIRHCLAEGYPFTVGISVYESFQSDAVKRTGIVPMPRRGERMLGGHAVLVVGYDDSRKHVIVQNSWGARWGDRGFFFLPYAFLLNPDHAWDLWTVRRMSDQPARKR
jgi:C1A family cysteine protease